METDDFGQTSNDLEENHDRSYLKNLFLDRDERHKDD
jgi:hypothetical protein